MIHSSQSRKRLLILRSCTKHNQVLLVCEFVGVLLGFIATWIPELHSENASVKLFSASSTSVPVRALVYILNNEDGIRIVPVFTASGALARQIEHGATADIFLFAHPVWMDRLERLKRLRRETRRDAIGNCLVLARAPTEPKLPSIAKILIEDFQRHRFAIGDPAFVPVGFYAKEVLDNLGALKKLSRTLARLPSARHVLWLLERGEVSAGFVYRSNIFARKNIQIDQTMYSEILYPIAMINRAHNSPQMESAYNFLTSPRAIQVLKNHGFRPFTKNVDRFTSTLCHSSFVNFLQVG